VRSKKYTPVELKNQAVLKQKGEQQLARLMLGRKPMTSLPPPELAAPDTAWRD